MVGREGGGVKQGGYARVQEISPPQVVSCACYVWKFHALNFVRFNHKCILFKNLRIEVNQLNKERRLMT